MNSALFENIISSNAVNYDNLVDSFSYFIKRTSCETNTHSMVFHDFCLNSDDVDDFDTRMCLCVCVCVRARTIE